MAPDRLPWWRRLWLYHRLGRGRMTTEELDYEFLLPSLERAADARGLTGPERKAAIARAWELHQRLEGR